MKRHAGRYVTLQNKGQQGVVEMEHTQKKNFCQGVRQLHPEIAELVGSNAALLCNQIAFWCRNTKHRYNGQKIFYKSLTSWTEEFSWLSRATIANCLRKLQQKNLIIVRYGVIAGVDRRTPCYALNYENSIITEVFGDSLKIRQDSLKNGQDGLKIRQDGLKIRPKNADSLTAPTVPGPLRASENFKRSHSSKPLLPDWRILKPKTEAWLENLNERERLAVNIAVDREIEERGDSFRNHVALRIYVLWDFMQGAREMPEIDETQYSMIGAFKKSFAAGDDAPPAVELAEDAEPIQTEVPMTYDEEMQAEYAQQFENMEESHAYH